MFFVSSFFRGSGKKKGDRIVLLFSQWRFLDVWCTSDHFEFLLSGFVTRDVCLGPKTLSAADFWLWVGAFMVYVRWYLKWSSTSSTVGCFRITTLAPLILFILRPLCFSLFFLPLATASRAARAKRSSNTGLSSQK